MARLYTRRGDHGETDGGGRRVAKDDPLIELLGALDELTAALGAARAEAGADTSNDTSNDISADTSADTSLHTSLDRQLAALQSDLLVIGAELGAPAAGLRLADNRVAGLEQAIDAAAAALPPLTRFILPGGTRLACALHQARVLCRRAERRLVSRQRTAPVRAPVRPPLLAYLNRAADLLFVLARAANHRAGIDDETWTPDAS